MKTIKVRIPKPQIVTSEDGTVYAWGCDHKTMGWRTLGDTAKEAYEAFLKDITSGVLTEESAGDWLGSGFNGVNIELAK